MHAQLKFLKFLKWQEDRRTTWRNGSASDSRSEGCVFESRRGQITFLLNKLFKACTGQMGIKRKTLCFLFSSGFMPDRFNYSPNLSSLSCKNTGGLRGAMVARLTPDQKVACSNHVVVKLHFF